MIGIFGCVGVWECILYVRGDVGFVGYVGDRVGIENMEGVNFDGCVGFGGEG